MSNQSTSRFGVGFLCGTVFGIVIAIGGWGLSKHYDFTLNLGQNSERQPTTSQAQSPTLKQSVQANPPQFDAKNLQRTASWSTKLMTELERVKQGQNTFATNSAREAVNGELKKIVGRSVDWQIPVVGVNQWVVSLEADFGNYFDSSRQKPHTALSLRRLARTKEELNNLVFTRFGLLVDREVPKKDAARLRQGDLVNVQGRVNAADLIISKTGSGSSWPMLQ